MNGLFFFAIGFLVGAFIYILFLHQKIDRMIKRSNDDQNRKKEIESNVEKKISSTDLHDLVNESNKRNGVE
jgi:hypothetical protein